MANASLCHDGNRNGANNAVDHVWVAHTGNATLCTDVGWHALKRHNGDSAGVLGNFGLFRRNDIHDYATLKHFGKTALDSGGGYVVVLRFAHVSKSNLAILVGVIAFAKKSKSCVSSMARRLLSLI